MALDKNNFLAPFTPSFWPTMIRTYVTAGGLEGGVGGAVGLGCLNRRPPHGRTSSEVCPWFGQHHSSRVLQISRHRTPTLAHVRGPLGKASENTKVSFFAFGIQWRDAGKNQALAANPAMTHSTRYSDM